MKMASISIKLVIKVDSTPINYIDIIKLTLVPVKIRPFPAFNTTL